MSIKCELRELKGQATLAVRTRAAVQDLSRVLGKAYGSVAQYLGELGEYPAGPPFVAYYNDDMEDLDIEAGFPVTGELPGRGDIEAGEIPVGKAAVCLYTGPYEAIEPAYNALSRFVEESDYTATGVVYEMYLNDPQETPSEELQTQIIFPLE